VRLGPADDAAAVTAAQVRQVVGRLISAGHLRGWFVGFLFYLCFEPVWRCS
jgi:hypothetical protein